LEAFQCGLRDGNARQSEAFLAGVSAISYDKKLESGMARESGIEYFHSDERARMGTEPRPLSDA